MGKILHLWDRPGHKQKRIFDAVSNFYVRVSSRLIGELKSSECLFPVCRMTSNIFPWCTFYDLEDLPDFPAIADELAFAGKLARAYDQRLTFHPSHFVKVAAAQEELLQRSLKELEVHSQVPPLIMLASNVVISVSFL